MLVAGVYKLISPAKKKVKEGASPYNNLFRQSRYQDDSGEVESSGLRVERG
jgi:hypothetical protein